MVVAEQRLPKPRVPSRSAEIVSESLPFRVELCDDDERVIARAQNSSLARVIFNAACMEYPGRCIVLKRGSRTIAKRDV